MRLRCSFTLIEIVTVLAVISIASAVAVSTFRGESNSQKLRRTGMEFEAFCARSRYAALEHGTEIVLTLEPDNGTFRADKPATDEAAEQSEAAEETENAENTETGEKRNLFHPLSWKLPENFECEVPEAENATDEEGRIELFRFHADGTASGSSKLTLRVSRLEQSFSVSPLTGLVRREIDDEEEKRQ